MNGRVAKKIRKLSKRNFYDDVKLLYSTLFEMTLWERCKFCYVIIFKRPWGKGVSGGPNVGI